MSKPTLYFLAIIPPSALREAIKSLKEEMRDRFDAGHALKSPAHITLQMPFRREEKLEKDMIERLAAFAAQQAPFGVELSGFDCFAPRVIYVRIANHEQLTDLHEQLKNYLLTEMNFTSEEVNARFHPHMTIATRDLRPEAFEKAWSEFSLRPFTGSFVADSLHLLKHNGRHWEIYRPLAFGG